MFYRFCPSAATHGWEIIDNADILYVDSTLLVNNSYNFTTFE